MKDQNYLIENGVNVQASLDLFGDIETYNQSIVDFLTDATEKLEQLRNYKESGDMSNYSIQVHALKSDAKYFGFEKLAELALDQEMKSKANDMFYICEHFDELEKETTRAINITKVYLGHENESILANNVIAVDNSPKDQSILVVDDSEVIKRFIEKIFNNKYEVLQAGDGLEAINIISRDNGNKIAGVLLDLNMPKVNGFQVLDYFNVNNLFEKIPVSIITGVGSNELVARAYDYPIIEVLRKPFNEKDIKRVVEETVSRFGQK